MSHDDASRIAENAERLLPLAAAHLSDDYFYQSVPLCVIDAVYSIGVRYEGVRAVVDRYCNRFGISKIRADKHALPPCESQESVSAFCLRFEEHGLPRMTDEVFANRQRTSTRSGILKAEAVHRFAVALRDHGVEHLQDVPAAAADESLERAVRLIPGQKSGISLQYFWMLAGSDDFIKPDRMVLRFLQSALHRRVSMTEAPELLRAATYRLNVAYPHLNPRVLDHEIWKHQRDQPPRPDADVLEDIRIAEEQIAEGQVVGHEQARGEVLRRLGSDDDPALEEARMWLEKADGDLRALAEHLLAFIEDLPGARVELEASSGLYKVSSPDGVFLYVRLIGPRARKYPKNSVHLMAKWDDSFTSPGIKHTTNWNHGGAAADFVVTPGDAEGKAQSEDFIRRAFRLRSQHPRAK